MSGAELASADAPSLGVKVGVPILVGIGEKVTVGMSVSVDVFIGSGVTLTILDEGRIVSVRITGVGVSAGAACLTGKLHARMLKIKRLADMMMKEMVLDDISKLTTWHYKHRYLYSTRRT